VATDYARARASAKRMISNYGQPSQVIKKGIAAGEPDAWGDISPAEPDTVIDGIITPWLDAKTGEIDGENILRGDGFVYFHSDTAPEINMQTTINGKTFRIVNTKVLDSVDDINVYRRLQLRT